MGECLFSMLKALGLITPHKQGNKKVRLMEGKHVAQGYSEEGLKNAHLFCKIQRGVLFIQMLPTSKQRFGYALYKAPGCSYPLNPISLWTQVLNASLGSCLTLPPCFSSARRVAFPTQGLVCSSSCVQQNQL